MSHSSKHNLRIIDSATFNAAPNRYKIRSGCNAGAPFCPYGNKYNWIGFDTAFNEFVRFTKSVFKKLITKMYENNQNTDREIFAN